MSRTVPEATAPGRVYGGETEASRTARRRRQILDAGLDAFGTRGYRATTVRDICRAARVAHRTFYEEFESLEDLLLAVYAECTGTLNEAVIAAVLPLDSGDVAARARAGMGAFTDVVAADPRLARVVWLEITGVSPRVESAYVGRMDDFASMIIAFLPAGAVDPADPRIRRLATATIGGVSHVVMEWVVSGMHQPAGDIAETLAQFLDAVAIAAVTPAPAPGR